MQMNCNMSGNNIFHWDFMSMVSMSENLDSSEFKREAPYRAMILHSRRGSGSQSCGRFLNDPSTQFCSHCSLERNWKFLWTSFFFEKKYLSQQSWGKKLLFRHTAAIPILMKVSYQDEKSYNRCNFMKYYIVATIASEQISP